MADDPVGHEAAVGPAENAQSLGIHVSLPDRPVDGRQQIRQVVLAPPTIQRAGEFIAVAGRTSWVRVEDDIAARRQHLEFMHQRLTVHAERSAVDFQQQRVLRGRVEARRLQHPAVDLDPIGARDAEWLRIRELHLLSPLVVEVGDLAQASIRVENPDVPDRCRCRDRDGEITARQGRCAADPVASVSQERYPAVWRRDSGELDGSFVAAWRQQRSTTRFPTRRSLREGSHVADCLVSQPSIEARAHGLRRAAARRDDEQLRPWRITPQVARPQTGDGGAIRRPRRTPKAARPIGDLAHRAPGWPDRMNVASTREFPAVVLIAAECDLMAGRRPRGVLVLECAVGELPRLSARNINQEDLAVVVVEEALAIEPEAYRRNDPDIRIRSLWADSHLRNERDLRAGWRPGEFLDRPGERCQAFWLAARRRDRPDLPLALLVRVAVGDEGDGGAVR